MKKFKCLFTLIILHSCITASFAQEIYTASLKTRSDSLRKANNKQTISHLFNGDLDRGIYFGLTNHLELLNYSFGGELKCYDSYYSPYLSGSCYLN
ncbi:MAG: hypothetical protein IAF38_15890 [Bacteroidia bacterium]|nr:hypothetical protein [Bacteroidia bacterium]